VSGIVAEREDRGRCWTSAGKTIRTGKFWVLFFSHSFIWDSHIYIVSVLLGMPTF
jgi:hypothetical protein